MSSSVESKEFKSNNNNINIVPTDFSSLSLPSPPSSSSSSSPPSSLLDIPIPPFSPQLDATLAELSSSTSSPSSSPDPLDSPSFDSISYINSNFPDESSLSSGKLDHFLLSLRRRVSSLQENIQHDVRNHALQRLSTRKAIEGSQQSIVDLFHKINSIKSKSQQSESMVQMICKDIRALDAAKTNLQNTVRALSNLHMLVSTVEQLDVMVEKKRYKDSARLLHAVDGLFKLFEKYNSVPKIMSLHKSVDETKQSLRANLTAEFHRLLPSPSVHLEPFCSQLSDGCQVVEVLDNGIFKGEILSWFTSYQLEEYVALYSYGKEGATMDQIERRYSWLRRLLSSYNEKYSKVFPLHWQAQSYISVEFCRITKIHIGKILSSTAGRFDVSHMIKALQKTIEFEKELNLRFRREKSTEKRDKETSGGGGEDEVAESMAVEAIKAKYKRKEEEKKLSELTANKSKQIVSDSYSSSSTSSSSSPTPSPSLIVDAADFSGSVSDVFTPYMTSYVDMIRKSMREVLEKIELEEKWNTPEEGKGKDRLGGADDLFIFIRESIKDCAKLVKNVTFLNIYKEYHGGLMKYCQILENHLPRKMPSANSSASSSNTNITSSGGSSSATSSSSTSTSNPLDEITIDTYKPLTPSQMLSICYIVNTCEYCVDQLPAMEDRIKKNIDDGLRKDVDLTSLHDEFSLLINQGIQQLVLSIWVQMGKVMSEMTKLPWGTWNVVGDESPYVLSLFRILKSDIPLISSRLSSKYHPFFCTQLAQKFIPYYIESIYKCRRINESGAQQMRIDVYTIKNILLHIPVISIHNANITLLQLNQDPMGLIQNQNTSAPSQSVPPTPSSSSSASSSSSQSKHKGPSKSYIKYVNTEMSKSEALIKTLVSPNDRLIITFKALLPKSTIDDLMRIMSLRGMKRSDMVTLVDNYNAQVQQEDKLTLKKETTTTSNFKNFISALGNSNSN